MTNVQINPRVIDGPEVGSLSDEAFRLWISCIAWQSQQGTDGWVTIHVARFYAGRRRHRLVKELVDARLWTEIVPGEYTIERQARGFELWRPGPSDRTRPPIDAALREAVYDRDGRACLRCGTTERLSLDHVIHWSAGGQDTYENLRTPCRPCNSSRGTKDDLEWLGGEI